MYGKIEMYCIKCRVKREVPNAKRFKFKESGRLGLKGFCPVCGTEAFKVLT